MSAVCQCAECDCERVDRSLNPATSSLLVCYSCCTGRHKYLVEEWCPTCNQRLPEQRLVGGREAGVLL